MPLSMLWFALESEEFALYTLWNKFWYWKFDTENLLRIDS